MNETTEEQWQKAMTKEAERIYEARKTCDHSFYEDLSVHGRCCPTCGTFLTDFGD